MQEKEIRWNTSLLLLSIFIFLTGCDTGEMGIPDPPKPLPRLPSISDKLVAHIYFDATLSMQGFVVPRSTRYTQICYPYLESVIGSGWRDGEAKFFRFGEQVEPINRDTYLRVGSKEFYESTNIYRETFIQKIIDYEDQLVNGQVEASNIPTSSTEMENGISNTPEESTEIVIPTEEVNESREEHRLVIIVTDLFQDNSDINLLVNQLKEKYIENGLEIGLFGLRSQFDGTVYDTGMGEAPMPYRSNPENPETFRPFYLLVLGKHADIAHYFDLLTANGFPESQTIIFSRYLVNPLLSFENFKPEIENLNRDTMAKKSDPQLKKYRITKKNKPSKISAKLKVKFLPHVMQFDSDTLDNLIIVKHAPIRKPNENQLARNCLKVTSTLSINNDGNELSIEFGLDSQSLPNKKVYLYEVTLRPEIDAFREPRWCSDWDMGDERNGSKTLNLLNFVRDLMHVTVRRHNPEIAKFYYYIEKR